MTPEEKETRILQSIMQVLGPAAVCECAGCAWETNEAIRLLNGLGITYRPGTPRMQHNVEAERRGNAVDWVDKPEPSTERPPDPAGRLLLNAYGRECYDAGRQSAKAELVSALRALLVKAEHRFRALGLVDFNERKQEFFCRVCRYRDPLSDGEKLHDDRCPYLAVVAAFNELAALCDAAER
jgi:hypothetical protein